MGHLTRTALPGWRWDNPMSPAGSEVLSRERGWP